MAFPSDLEIEVAFNNDFDETTYGQSGWTSVLPYVSSFDGDLRGREYELDQTEAGSLSVVLDNSDGRFLPGSVQSPYYPYVKSDRRFRIRGKNMVHPNVARGGSRDHNDSGFLTAFGDITKYSLGVHSMGEARVITASGENAPNETKEKAYDGLVQTKWLTAATTGWLQYKYAIGIRQTTYIVTSANDVPARDPKNWTLCGSNDGTTWTALHTVTGEVFSTRYEQHTYTIPTPNYYLYYRLNITLNNGDANTQLSEFNLFYDTPDDLLLPDPDLDWYMEVTLNQSLPSATYKTVAWYVPLEYGVRLAHSAYVWRISGTEPTGLAYKIQVDYYDSDFNLITVPIDIKDVVSTLPTSTTPAIRAVSHAPLATAKYAIAHFDVFVGSTTNTTPLIYGITGIQSELPANLAPDISGYRDINNWQVEGDGDGDYYNIAGGGNPVNSYLEVKWGANDTNLFITIPHLIPGEAYTATAEAKIINSGPSVQFTGNEGETGPIVSATSFTQYTCSFIAQQSEQELRWVLQEATYPWYDFESGITGWTASGVTMAASTAQAHGGTQSLLMTVTGSPTQGLVRNTNGIAVTIGHSYTAEMWVYRPVAGNANATIDWYTSGQVYISTSSATVAISANTWTKISVTATAPATAAFAWIGPTIGSSPANGTQLYLDDVSLYDNTSPGIPALQVRNLRVELGDALTLSLPTTAIEAGNTTWIRPKDIFEGWVEAWPAVAGSNDITITVTDRMKRLGSVELSNTLRESLFVDNPSLLLPLSDSMIDTPGRFSQLGKWSAEEAGPTYVDISHSRGDLGVASYTTSTDDGPTGEASWKGNPVGTALSAVGYFFNIPYSKDYIAPVTPPVTTKPKPKPPPASTPTQKSTYTKKWYATWSRSYEGDDSTRFDDSPYMYQGSYDSSSPGNQKSLAGFDWKNIAATLKGADILECYITIKNAHARWNKGLYAQVGTHDYISKPSTWNGSVVVERRYGKKWVVEGGTLTINTGIQLGKEFLNGSTRGISIGPEVTNDHDNYGYFYGASHSARPYITIKYRK